MSEYYIVSLILWANSLSLEDETFIATDLPIVITFQLFYAKHWLTLLFCCYIIIYVHINTFTWPVRWWNLLFNSVLIPSIFSDFSPSGLLRHPQFLLTASINMILFIHQYIWYNSEHGFHLRGINCIGNHSHFIMPALFKSHFIYSSPTCICEMIQFRIIVFWK